MHAPYNPLQLCWSQNAQLRSEVEELPDKDWSWGGETTHSGMPAGYFRAQGLGWMDGVKNGGDYFHTLEMRCMIRIERAEGWVADLLDVPEGYVVIYLNAAPLQRVKEDDCADYETWIVPAQEQGATLNRHYWKVAWSVARRLALATPARPALIADGEWAALESAEISGYHENCWLDTAHARRGRAEEIARFAAGEVDWKRVCEELPDDCMTVLGGFDRGAEPVMPCYYDSGAGEWCDTDGTPIPFSPVVWRHYPELPPGVVFNEGRRRRREMGVGCELV